MGIASSTAIVNLAGKEKGGGEIFCKLPKETFFIPWGNLKSRGRVPQ